VIDKNKLPSKESGSHYIYKDEEVTLITIFSDSDIALVEDAHGEVIAVALQELQQLH
jgi:hypothetical protein